MEIIVKILPLLGSAVLGFLLNLWLENIKKQKKKLSYKHTNVIPLAKIERRLNGLIKIRYKNKEVKNLYYSVITIKNEGNTIIENQNIIINFRREIEVISSIVPQNIPDESNTIGKVERKSDCEYIFTINYLNIKESVELEFLTSCEKYTEPKIIGRGKNLVIKQVANYHKWFRVISAIFGSVIGILLMLPFKKIIFYDSWKIVFTFLLISIIVNITFIYFESFRKRKKDEANN